MDEWFCVDLHKTRRGPFSRAELLLFLSTFPPAAARLVWREGLKEWTDAASVPELTSPSGDLPPLPISTKSSPAPEEQAISPLSPQLQRLIGGIYPDGFVLSHDGNFHPWRRYVAKMVDIMIFSVLGALPLGIVLALLFPGVDFNHPSYNALFTLLAPVVWLAIEPAWLAKFQTTPGRSLFRIKLVTSYGEPITRNRAYQRGGMLWFRGLACGFQPVTLGAVYLAYRRLNNSGGTSWDRDAGFVVLHNTISAGRWVLIVGSALGLLISVAALDVWQP